MNVLPGVVTDGDDAPVPILIALYACDQSTVDAPGKRSRRLLTARLAATPRKTGLRALRGVDAEEADPSRVHLDGVAVDHTRVSHEVCLNRPSLSSLKRIARSARRHLRSSRGGTDPGRSLEHRRHHPNLACLHDLGDGIRADPIEAQRLYRACGSARARRGAPQAGPGKWPGPRLTHRVG